MKACPAKPFIHSQVSRGRRARYVGKVELRAGGLSKRFLTEIRYQRKVNAA